MATTKATNLGHRSDVTLKGTTTTIETDVVVSDTTTINNAGSDVGLKINSESTGHIMQLQDDSTDVMVVADGGNVGIGTDSPTSVLTVKSDTANDLANGIRFEGHNSTNTPVLIYENGTGEGTLELFDDSTKKVRIRTRGESYFNGGNVGIGRSPNGKFDAYIGSGLGGLNVGAGGASATYLDSDNIYLRSGGGTERMRIDSSGNLKFNSGFGSVGTAYGCRAWVNFDGTSGSGTGSSDITIRGSGNVSSITDDGAGLYQMNFSTAMPDANYAVIMYNNANPSGTGRDYFSNDYLGGAGDRTTAKVNLRSYSSASVDSALFDVVIFR